jgi:hypothetical protein
MPHIKSVVPEGLLLKELFPYDFRLGDVIRDRNDGSDCIEGSDCVVRIRFSDNDHGDYWLVVWHGTDEKVKYAKMNCLTQKKFPFGTIFTYLERGVK